MKRTSIGLTLSFLLLAACSDDASSSGDSSQSAGPNGGTNGSVANAKFFLPTGAEVDNTASARVEVDATGATHAVYPAFAIGGAYYAYCGAGCAGPEQTKVVKFETDGTVTNAMIALTKEGHPRLLLAAYADLYWAACDASCGEQASWTVAPILHHGSDRDVTGEALALDPQGRPRFLMHTTIAYLGIGQKTPETLWVTCDAACEKPESWTQSVMQAEIMQSSSLHFDANGVAKVATITEVENNGTKSQMAAYLECASGCTKEDDWKGIGLGATYSSEYEAVRMKPTVSMALTKAGQPRIAFMAKSDAGSKEIRLMGCDGDCSTDHWKGVVVSNHEKLAEGLDIALDASDHPRIAYNLSYNIGVATCEHVNCETGEHPWDLEVVELGSDIPADQIFLYANCNVSAWFLHSPSIALTPNGDFRVGYQARDISGGWQTPEPGKAGCTAGTDMSWTRLALVGR